MSRNGQGGTQKWCPSCDSIQVCTAVNPSKLGYESSQRWHWTKHKDIQWFRRGLICRTCTHQWLTAEVKEEVINELVELRDALKEIKANAEAYVKEADKAAKLLAKLSKSLSVLRALKIYNK